MVMVVVRSMSYQALMGLMGPVSMMAAPRRVGRVVQVTVVSSHPVSERKISGPLPVVLVI